MLIRLGGQAAERLLCDPTLGTLVIRMMRV
jgi:hypothetical protein